MKKRILSCLLCLLTVFSLFVGCNNKEESSNNGGQIIQPSKNKIEVTPTVYEVDEIVEATKTQAGSASAWQEQGNNSWSKGDLGTPNSVIKSPWHSLKINGVEVPVYSTRCGEGTHSFAWVDVKSESDTFELAVQLTMDQAYGKCVVLPESRGVDVAIYDNEYNSVITTYGSYSYTFAKKESAKFTDPTLAPLTIMVQPKEDYQIPDDALVYDVPAGYIGTDDLEFTKENAVYRFKAGFYQISNIRLPSNSVLLIERGAYIKVEDRQYANGSWNRDSAIDIVDAENVQIISRGLLDIGAVKGGDNKNKHVVGVVRSDNVSVKGLTIINSNTWTMCFYNCSNSLIERNLLLGYRTYSDGIMMSECVDSVGRYNFVRTGDDAIEYKGTGWNRNEIQSGKHCLYEYNDCWTDKGAGYCVTWESDCSMSGMKFENNTIGFAQPLWSSGNAALDCRLGTNPNSTWGQITFSNIEIYYVYCPQVVITQITGAGAKLQNITFKNISVKGTEWGVYAYTMLFTATGGSIDNIVFNNYDFCGKVLTANDINNPMIINNQAGAYINELTIK